MNFDPTLDTEKYLEEEIIFWNNQIHLGEDHVTKISDEILSLEKILDSFEIKYKRKIVPLIKELDKINILIDEYTFKTDLLRTMNLNEEEIDKYINNKFKDEWKSWEKKYTQVGEEFKSENINENESPTLNKELRLLYKILAKLFHPDKAKNEKQKKFFHNLMVQINNAYAKKDLYLLKEIYFTYVESEIKGNNSKIKILENKLFLFNRIKIKHKQLHERLNSIKNSKLYALYIEFKKSNKDLNSFLDEIAKNIENEIKEKKEILFGLKNGV